MISLFCGVIVAATVVISLTPLSLNYHSWDVSIRRYYFKLLSKYQQSSYQFYSWKVCTHFPCQTTGNKLQNLLAFVVFVWALAFYPTDLSIKFGNMEIVVKMFIEQKFRTFAFHDKNKST